MEHKIIKTENYLLVVSNDEIKVGDFITDTYKVWKWNDDCSLLGRRKIIAHLPLNNSPVLESVDLIQPLEPLEQEDDVEKLAYEYSVDYRCPATNDQEYCKHDIISAFNNGYNKAKEKYKYTERQLDVAIDWGIKKGREGDVTITDIDNFIQSL